MVLSLFRPVSCWVYINHPRREPSCYMLHNIFCMYYVHSVNSSPPGQNGRQLDRWHFEMHFSEYKIKIFWFEFHWRLFLRIRVQLFSIGSCNGLTPNRRQAIAWTNDDPVHRRIYAALRRDALTRPPPHPLHKMAAISQTIYSEEFSWMKKFQISDHGLALTSHGDKQWPEPALPQFPDAYMRH